MDIDHHFPGANAIVEGGEDNTFVLRPDWSPSGHKWFYIHFRLTQAAGQAARLVFPEGDPFGALGPAVSFDGKTWKWLERSPEVDDGGKVFLDLRFEEGQDSAWISTAIPYLRSDLDSFLRSRPQLECASLGRSEEGREIPLLRRASRTGECLLITTARLHACETMGSFALEGWLDAWDEDSPEGEWLRTHADLAAVPLFDIDGVEKGEQGKGRLPHDHNRDFIERRYAANRAFCEALPGWRGERIVGLDFHCPWIRDGRNEELFLVGKPEPWDTLRRAYAQVLEATQQAGFSYRAANDIPFGTEWNTNFETMTAGFVASDPRTLFACTVEIPYALAGGVAVFPEGARALGRDIARAQTVFLG